MSLNSVAGGSPDLSSFYVSSSIVENAIENYHKGESDKALKLLATALKTQRLTLGDADICVAHTLGNIGAIYITLGWYDEAIQVLEECLNVKTRIRSDSAIRLPEGCEHISLYDTLNNLGGAAFLAGDHMASMAYYQECLKELTSGEIPSTAIEIANTVSLVFCTIN